MGLGDTDISIMCMSVEGTSDSMLPGINFTSTYTGSGDPMGVRSINKITWSETWESLTEEDGTFYSSGEDEDCFGCTSAIYDSLPSLIFKISSACSSPSYFLSLI